MTRKMFLFILLLFMPFCINAQNAEKEIFTSPLKITPALSATFAELRNDHFHSGLDYKTGGVTGREVCSSDEGFVYRISVSPFGFGKALYVRHPSGYSTVYAHLESFRADIEEFVNKRQYELRSFTVNLYPSRNQFPVKRGAMIALSGNSGASGGPHLHFEVRESSTEDPLNPLLFDFGISDKERPVIEKIILYPLTRYSTVNSSHEGVSFRATGSSGSYTINAPSPVTVNGLIGVGVKCWDSSDNSPNKCGVYSIEVIVDSVSVYTFRADRFSFAESRFLNSHIDYRSKVVANEYLHKAFLEPGNRLSMYSGLVNRGKVIFEDNKEHRIQVRVKDAAGNLSVASFKVRSAEHPPVPPAEIKCSKILPFGKASDFSADGIRIHFPASAFYDTLFMNYRVKGSAGRFLSPVHSVHDEAFAVNSPFRISIMPDTVITEKEDKLCLASIDRKGNASFSGGETKYGFVTAEVRRLGDYAVSIDTIKPEIIPSFASGAVLTGENGITFTIRDDFSGINTYEAFIDGTWALLEYVPGRNMLIYHPDSSRIRTGKVHTIVLKVTDNRGNREILNTEFTW